MRECARDLIAGEISVETTFESARGRIVIAATHVGFARKERELIERSRLGAAGSPRSQGSPRRCEIRRASEHRGATSSQLAKQDFVDTQGAIYGIKAGLGAVFKAQELALTSLNAARRIHRRT